MNADDGLTMQDEDDPIVEEVRRIRQKIYERVGGTPEAYCRHYIEMGKARIAAEKAAAAAASGKAKPVTRKRSRKTATA